MSKNILGASLSNRRTVSNAGRRCSGSYGPPRKDRAAVANRGVRRAARIILNKLT